MNALAQLATSALLGTERCSAGQPAVGGAIGDLVRRVPKEPAEKALLHAAGVIGTCHLAGWNPAEMPQAVEPAPREPNDVQEVPATLVPVLGSILADGPARLQAEAFRRLAGAGCLLPHRLLPKALDCGKRSTELRPHLLPVLGRRGAWIAAQNDAWAFAAESGTAETGGTDEGIWEHGSLDQRKLFLTALRRRDAARARGLITAAMGSEGARERAALLECLAVGLNPDDEDLLESALTDKSKETRQIAARLLTSMANTRYTQRMAARLDSCLSSEKKFLRGTVLTLEPPSVYDPTWKADLIEEERPKGLSMGDRAWWLFQIVRAAPLAWWESRSGMTAADLLTWAAKTDWKEALLQGWAAAQALQKQVTWAEAFLETQIPQGSGLNALDLLETLPLPLREKHFLRLFTTGDSRPVGAGSAMLDRFLASIELDAPPLSTQSAKSLVQLLKRRINSGAVRYDWQLRASLVELACVVPPSLFDECAAGWEITKEEAQPFAEAIARLGIVLEQRKQLQQLQPKSQP